MDSIATNLVSIVKDLGETFSKNLEEVVGPLKGVISMIWSTTLDELFKENLYFLFDKILDIMYCTSDSLEVVWHGAINVIESKVSDISGHILELIEAVHRVEFDEHLSVVHVRVTKLTVSLVGLTAFLTAIIRLIPSHYAKDIFVIVSTTASLQLIHEYTLSSVACTLSRTVQVLDSLITVSNTAIPLLGTTIINFILDVEKILLKDFDVATMSDLFNGNLMISLSQHLLTSVTGLMTDITFNTMQSSTLNLYSIAESYTAPAFSILPDLLGDLIDVLFGCSRIPFNKLEQRISYAFDGLLDVVHYISYDLNQDIKSSASTGSFQEPSEPIDIALDSVIMSVKNFIRGVADLASRNKTMVRDLILNISVGAKDLIQALLAPMNIILYDERYADYGITMVSSLQFIVFYVIGSIATSLLSARKILHDFGDIDEAYLNVNAVVTLALIKVQLVFDYSTREECKEVLRRLFSVFIDLQYDLVGVFNKFMNVIGGETNGNADEDIFGKLAWAKTHYLKEFAYLVD